jgi:ankyrin repeat protein
MLRGNDLPRLIGYETYQTLKDPSLFEGKTKKKDKKSQTLQNQEILLTSSISRYLLPKAPYQLSALYTAAFKNDIKTIHEISKLNDINPNERNKENGYTALHIAISQNNEEAVRELLFCFSNKMNINLQETSFGDTSLHIAAKKLLKNMVMMLCDEESCNPLAFRNYVGDYPLDICYIQNIKHNNSQISHEIWQIITVTIERNKLTNELQQLQKKMNSKFNSSFSSH